jgi:hypothetical protein
MLPSVELLLQDNGIDSSLEEGLCRPELCPDVRKIPGARIHPSEHLTTYLCNVPVVSQVDELLQSLIKGVACQAGQE